MNSRFILFRGVTFLLAIVFFVKTTTSWGQSIKQDSIKNTCLKNIRDFRDSLISNNYNDTTRLLIRNVSTLLKFIESSKNSLQDSTLNNYFNNVKENLVLIPTMYQKNGYLIAINQDLSFKISQYSKPNVNRFESSDIICEVKTVAITVFINGEMQKDSCYEVYWENYPGGDRLKLINSTIPGGSAKKFINPYDLDIILPGRVTFWIRNAETRIVFKSSQNYFDIGSDRKKLDVYFIPLNK